MGVGWLILLSRTLEAAAAWLANVVSGFRMHWPINVQSATQASSKCLIKVHFMNLENNILLTFSCESE